MAVDDVPIGVRREGRVHVVDVPGGALLDEDRIHPIAAAIGALIDREPHPRLVVSLAHVGTVSSMVLGEFITLHNRARSKQGQMCLAGLSPRIVQLLSVTRLDAVFVVHATAEEAVAAMA